MEQVVEENDKDDEFSDIDGLPADLLPQKPKYFSEFDGDELDSEEELVAGENNYIEINCMPFDVPEEVEAAPANLNAPPADLNPPANSNAPAVEEEKKEVAPDTPSPGENVKNVEEEKKTPVAVAVAAV